MYSQILWIFCILTAYSAAQEICRDPNAKFNSCGSPCDETCEGRAEECAEICVPKCECNPGFVLHKDKCIRREDCKNPKCEDPHMEYTECGTYCPSTCDQPEVELCVDACFVGCQCKEGFLLHKGRCVKPKQCESEKY